MGALTLHRLQFALGGGMRPASEPRGDGSSSARRSPSRISSSSSGSIAARRSRPGRKKAT